MSKEKISSQEIIDLLAAETNFSKRQLEDFLKALFGIIEERLIVGEPVKIKNLGTFKSQWNESRKSVNVQTGEEFVIPGYKKISFTPDSNLKLIVNEPFAHLEAVILDSNTNVNEEIIENAVETEEFEPLNILTEQALEIKGLLSEIQGFSILKEEEPIINPDLEEIKVEDKDTEVQLASILPIDDSTVNIFDKIQEKMHQKPEEILEIIDAEIKPEDPINQLIPESKIAEPEIIEMSKTYESEIEPIQNEEIEEALYIETKSENSISEIIPEQNSEEKIETYTPGFLSENESKKTNKESSDDNLLLTNDTNNDSSLLPSDYKIKRKSKWWLILLLIFLAIIIGLVSLYYLSSATRCWVKYELFSDENKEKTAEIKNNILNIFGLGETEVITKPVSIKKDSVVIPEVKEDSIQLDTIPTPQVKETVVDVFDMPREYKEFLGSEKIGQGNTLTNISKKYYGHKDFWVYIYEANKEKIKNPDNISVGTEIKIPKIDLKLIDLGNPLCLKKAKELHDKYILKN